MHAIAGNYFKQPIVTFNGVDRQVEGYSTDNYTQWAIDYLQNRQRRQDKPWYLWLCHGDRRGGRPETVDWDSAMLMTHTARTYGDDPHPIPTGEALTVTGDIPWHAMPATAATQGRPVPTP